jgi:twitching motility protein PilT
VENIVKAAVERGASDIHIKAGDVFRARINGKLQPLTKQRLTPDQTKSIAETLISSDEVRANIDNLKDYDCTWGAPGIGRFRVNILRQRSSFMVVLRVIPFEIQTLEKLHLPVSVQQFAERDSGLILIAGATQPTTSDVMAAVIHHINSSSEKHIVTLESPIEFLHRDINCSITQREIGTDTDDVVTGLKATLRQDPDVIMMGRPLDHATIEPVLEAAESGLLVVARINATDVGGAVTKVVSLFPPSESALARVRVVDSLVGVVALRKMARVDGADRASVAEVLVVTSVAQEMLRQGADRAELRGYLEAHSEDFGMRSYRQHAAELVSAGVIADDAAHVFDTDLVEEDNL